VRGKEIRSSFEKKKGRREYRKKKAVHGKLRGEEKKKGNASRK